MKPTFTAIKPDLKHMDIRLWDDRNTEQVYWSKQYNSYVVHSNPTGWWWTADGTPCDLVSVNGHGEIRWVVSSDKGNTSGDLDAAAYFGLTWRGWQ